MLSNGNDSQIDNELQAKPSAAERHLDEAHRLMEQLEDRVLFDAVPDAAGGIDPNVLEQTQNDASALAQIQSSEAEMTRTEVVFVDMSVEGSDQLLEDLMQRQGDGIEVHLLDPNSDGVEQIAAALEGRRDVDAVHIISHGSQGRLQLGSSVLDVESMQGQYADELQTISEALGEGADLLIYGCNFGEGQLGQEAADLLSVLTGADVGASVNETGIESLGGDWQLEYTTGELQSEIIVSGELQENWNVILATPAIEFFVPLDEQGIFNANEKILDEDTFGNVSELVETRIGIVANNDNTVIFYDHHEDGYETDLSNPVQATTEIWGDGDISNGAAPGVTSDADDVLNAGDFVLLANQIDLNNLPTAANPLYDGTDRFASDSSLAVTRGAWHPFPGTPLAGTTEVADIGRWGTEYTTPLGEDTDLNNIFDYTGLFVIAAHDNTTVAIDVNADGDTLDAEDVNITLNQGESYHVDGGVLEGATVTASDRVGVNLITGDRDSGVDSRWYLLRPSTDWFSSYLSPASTVTADAPASIVVFNPHATDLVIEFETLAGITTETVPAGSTFIETLSLENPASAVRVRSADGRDFYAVLAMDTDANSTTNDWGYSLLPEDVLTEMVLAGWSPGSSDLSENGSPIWVTTNADTTLYVDFDGDSTTGALVDPFGRRYDINVDVSRLEITTLYDTINNDNDQTGTRIYTLDGTDLSAAWGQDPSTAGPGSPFLDMGTVLLPFPLPTVNKTVAITDDLNSNLAGDPGDTLTWTITVTNNELFSLGSPVVLDTVPANTTYVAGSTFVDGVLLADDLSGSTLLRLDEGGFALPTIDPGESVVVTFQTTLNPFTPVYTEITNTVIVDSQIGTAGATAPLIINTQGPEIDLDGNDSTASGADYVGTFTEDGGPVSIFDAIDGDAEITDPDSNHLTSLTIDFTDPRLGDSLSIGALPPGITISSQTATQIVLAGTATLADYLAAVESVEFDNSSDNPDLSDRHFTVSGTDGTFTSNVATATIQVQAENDAPEFGGLDNTPTYVENATGIVLDGNATISDIELDAIGDYDGAILTLARSGGADAQDLFGESGSLGALTEGAILSVGGTNIGTVTTNSAGTLELTFNNNATPSLVDQTLQQITYGNSSDAPPATVTIDYTINDGNAPVGGAQGIGGPLEGNGSITVTITPQDDPPIASDDFYSSDEDTVFTLTPNGVLSNDNDPDLDPLSVVAFDPVSTLGATVVVNPDGSLSYDPNSSFTLQSLAPGATIDDTFTYTIEDPSGLQSTATVTITISGLDDGLLAFDDVASTDEDNAANVAAPGVLVNDGDLDGGPGGGTVTITELNGSAYTPGTAIVLPSGSTLTLNSDGSYIYDPTTQPSYQTLNNGETAADSFTYSITDGSTTQTANVDITINGVNDQVAATNLNQTISYNEEDSTVDLNDIVVADVDANEIVTATLTLSDVATGALTANNGATYDILTGVWSITGTTSAVNTALANLQFLPVSDNDTASHIDVVIADANEDGTVALTGRLDLAPVAVNDAPIATVPAGSISALEELPATIAGISFSDIDAGSNDVTVTLSANNGILTVDTTVPGGLSAGEVAANGSSTVTLTGSISQINASLAAATGLQYQGDLDFNGADTLTVNINDGGNVGVDPSTVGQPATGGPADEQDTEMITINVSPSNDPPVLDLDANNTTTGGADYETTFTEGSSPIAIADSDTSVIDVDDTNIESALITLTNPQSGDFLIALDSDPNWPAGITAVVTGTSDQVALTGSASKADFEAAIELIRFGNISNDPPTVDRILNVTVNDGDTNSNTAVSTIHVVALPDLMIGDASVTESGNLVFDLTLDSPAIDDIVLNLATSSGTATDGVDFENSDFEFSTDGGSTWLPASGGSGTEVTLPAGNAAIQVRINTFDDVYAESDETLTLMVESVVSGTIDDTSDTGTGTIIDDNNDAAIVSILGPASVVEGATTGNYTVSLDNPAATDATVNLSYSGTAADGTDFNGVASVVVLAGNSSTTFDLNTINDGLFEGSETIIIDIDSVSGGGFEDVAEHSVDNQVTTTITDAADQPAISVNNIAVTEEGDMFAVFTISLSNASFEDISAGISLGDNTATGLGVDFGTTGVGNLQIFNGTTWVDASTVTIAAGDTSVLARTPITDDVFEDDGETFTLTANVTAGATSNPTAQGTGTISDEATPDNATVSLTGPTSVNEGDVTTPYVLDVDFVPVTDITVTLAYSGTAANGADFSGVTPVTISAGSQQASFMLSTIDDGLFEGTENIVVTIQNVSGGGFESITIHATDNSVTTNIIDNDSPDIAVSSVTVTEEIDGFAVFDVTLSNTSVEDIVFDLTLTDQTANGSGVDFGSTGIGNLQVFDGSAWVDASSATILAGDLSVQVRTPIADDFLADDGETFTLTATVTNGTTNQASATGTGTISDESSADTATVSISGPGSVAEGVATTNYTVSVDQTPATDLTVNLAYSGTAGDGTDFTGVADVTIAAGTTATTFSLNTIADSLAEGAESIVIDIDSLVGGGFEAVDEHPVDNQVTTTIVDDDTALWSISGALTANEGASAGYTIELNRALGAGGTATITVSQTDIDTIAADLGLAGNNETDVFNAINAAVGAYAGPGSLTFNAGSGVLTFTANNDGDQLAALNFSVAAFDDALLEGDEDFSISLSAPSSSSGASVGLGNSLVTTTIVDNDAAVVSIAATANGDEAGADGEFTVTISQTSSTDTVIDYTVAGSAVEGTDFGSLSGQVTVLAGQTTATIEIPTIDDSLIEVTETVQITLDSIVSGDPSVLIGGTNSASVNLADDDAGLWSISGDATVTESLDAAYTIALTGTFGNSASVSVDVALIENETTAADHAVLDTAIATAVGAYSGPGDYAWDGTTLTWTADADGQSPGNLAIALTATADSIVEGDETYSIDLSSPGSATASGIALSSADSVTTTIIDSDTAQVTIAATTHANEAGLVDGVFTVNISTPASSDTVIDYTVGGSAVEGTDFANLSGQVTILAGQSNATIQIPVLDDSTIEGTETVSVSLTGISTGDPLVSIGSQSVASIDVFDNDTGEWNIVGDATVAESANASYTISFDGVIDSGQSANINLVLANVDTTSADYADFSAVVASATGNYSGPGSYAWDGTTLTWTADGNGQTPNDLQLILGAADDSIVEGDEDYTITLSSPTGSVPGVNLGASTAVTTTITDNDVATISIVPDADGNEELALPSRFLVRLTTPSSTNTVVNYTVSGSATSGDDFTPLSGQVTIAAGATGAVITAPTIDDVVAEPTENITVTLTSIASGDPQISIGGTSSASTNLFDNDTVVWSITGDSTVNEGANANYTIELVGSLQNGDEAVVQVALVDVDTDAADYASFDSAVAAAVVAYSGNGSYSWDGSFLTWTASADGQTPGALNISLGAIDDMVAEITEDYQIVLSNASVVSGAAASIDVTNTNVTTAIVNEDAVPSTANNTVSTNEDTPLPFTAADFAFSDSDLGDTLQSIRIATLPSAGALTLGGSDVVPGQVIPVGQISNLSFLPFGDENGASYTTFTFTVSDGTNESLPATMTIDVVPVNDEPAFSSLDNTSTYTEGAAGVVLDSNATLADIELDAINNYDGSTLTLARDGGSVAEDSFGHSGTLLPLNEGNSITVNGALIGSVATNSGGTLELEFNANATSALVDATLQQITYSNTSDDPPGSVTIEYLFDDGNVLAQGIGGNLTDSGFIDVTIVPVNDAPNATDNSNTIAEDGATVGGNIISDDDGNGVDSDPENDPLAVTEIDGVTSPASDVTGTYGTLDWEADGSYVYTIDNGNPAVQALSPGESLTDVFTYTVSDGNGGTDTADLTITITGTNDLPVAMIDNDSVTEDITLVASGNVLTNDSDVDASDTLTVTQVDMNAANVGNSVMGFFGSVLIDSDGQYTYTLDNSLATIQALQVGDTLSDTFIYTVSDSNGGSVTETLDITINGTNDVPTIDLDGSDATAPGNDYTAEYTEGSLPIPIAAIDTTITDIDDTNIESAVITLTNPQVLDQLFALDFAPNWPAGISATVNASGDQVTLTGSAALADYETAISLVQFGNGLQNPDATDRLITVTVNDGAANSATATSTIQVSVFSDLEISSDLVREADDLIFELVLDSPAQGDIVLELVTTGATATDGVDYENVDFEYLPDGSSVWLPAGGPNGTHVTFADGETRIQVRINTFDDFLDEPNEELALSVASVVSGTIGDTSSVGIGTITDEVFPDEAVVSIVGPAVVAEGDTTTNYTVSVDQVPVTDVTVNLAYSGTATNGSDFAGVASVTILAGDSNVDFTIDTLNDAVFEGAEDIVVDIDSINGGGFEGIVEHATQNQVTTSIIETAAPIVSVTNVTVAEDADLFAVFTISISDPSTEDIAVDVALTDDTAEGGGVDFGSLTAANLQVFINGAWVDATNATIDAGETSILVRTPIIDDVLDDAGDMFQVTAMVTAGTTGNSTATGIGTILDDPVTPDDATVTLIGPTTVNEGDLTTPYTLEVDFTANTDIVVTLNYSGTASDGSDFVGTATATILTGDDQTTFTLPTIDDAIYEGAESIIVSIAGLAGGGFENIVAHPTLNTVTTEIVDDDLPTLTVSNVSSTEEIDGYAVFTVSLDTVSIEDVSFELALNSGTALGEGVDFGSAGSDNLQVFDGLAWVDASTATIAGGQTSVNVRTAIIDDAFSDSGETYTLTATVISGTTSNTTAVGTGTIDDEATADTTLVSIVGPTTVVEGDTTTPYTVAVDSTPGTDVIVSLSYSGTAVDGTDFNGVAGVIIEAGTNSTDFTIDSLADVLSEGPESFVIDIANISGGDFENIAADPLANQVTTSITDDDSTVWSISGDATVNEGGIATYDLQQTGALGAGESVAITLNQVDMTTEADDLGTVVGNEMDFYAAVNAAVASYSGPGAISFDDSTGTLTFTAANDGDLMSILSINLQATDDSVLESAEDYRIDISNAQSATGVTTSIGNASQSTVINDNDSAVVSIAATTDGDESGPIDGQFTVSITAPADTDTVVDYLLAGTATQGADYASVTGQVTIVAGSTSAVIDIVTTDDILIEGTETVSATLVAISTGDPDISLGSAVTASIELSDNDAGQWNITGDTTVAEGFNADYTITLSGIYQAGEVASVDVVIADIDTLPDDYTDFDLAITAAVDGYSGPGSFTWEGTTLTWTAGSDGETPDPLNISLIALDDSTVEIDERYSVGLVNPASSTGASITIGVDTVTTTIVDGDTAVVDVVTTSEGHEDGPQSTVFTVSISNPVSSDTVIEYTLSGTATSGSDFTPETGFVTILAGETSAIVTLPTIDDTLIEGTEDIAIELTGFAVSNPNITLGTTMAVAQVQDNDAAIWSITGDTSVDESDIASYTISLGGGFGNGDSAQVQLSIADVDTLPADYANFDTAVTDAVNAYTGPGTYSWDGTTLGWTANSPGQTAGDLVVNLAAIDDASLELNEDYTVSLSNPSSSSGVAISLGTPAVTTTILDNDTAIVTIAATTDASESGPVDGVFTVSISAASSTDTVVDYALSGATDGSDFASVSGQVTILAGDTTATITLSTIDDAIIEGAEDVTASLTGIPSGSVGVTIGSANSAVITLTDNDAAIWSITGDTSVNEAADATYEISLSGLLGAGESASIEVAITELTTTSVDHADFSTSITDAVAAYTGPGTYTWDGTTLTWTANADGQAADNLIVTLNATDDTVVEGAEDYRVSLANPGSSTGASVSLGTASVTTVINDDDVATVSVVGLNDAFETGPTNGQFEVLLSSPSSSDTVIDFTLTGTAVSGLDYTPIPLQVTILAGQTSAIVEVPAIDDAEIEAPENVQITLDSISSSDPEVTIGGVSTASIAMVDNDGLTWTITGDSVVDEGNVASYTIQLLGSAQVGELVSVELSLQDGTTNASDYTSFNGAVGAAVNAYTGPGNFLWDGTTLTWTTELPGEAAGPLVVSLGTVGDLVAEGDEDYDIVIANAMASLGTSAGVDPVENEVNTTIADDDSRPTTSDQIITIDEDTVRPLSIADFVFNDADGDSIQSITLTTLPTAGTLLFAGTPIASPISLSPTDVDNLVFEPAANEKGSPYDSFTFSVSDGTNDSLPGLITINVLPVNDAPVFNSVNNSPTFTEGMAPVLLDGDATIMDLELDAIDNFDGSTLTLQRNLSANGEDMFTQTGTLAPLTEGGPLVVGGTSIGTVVSNSAGSLLLSFDANATGDLVDQVLQQIAYSNTSNTPPPSVLIDLLFDDGNVLDQGSGGPLLTAGSILVNISEVNDPPIATDNTRTLQEDVTTFTTGNLISDDDGFGVDVDLDVELLSISQIESTTNPADDVVGMYGVLTWDSAGGYSYTLDGTNPAVNGLDDGETLVETFTYTVTDGTATDTATLTITILGTNDLPVAVNDANTVVEDSPLNPISGNVTFNDIEPDDTLVVTLVDGNPANVDNPLVSTYGTLILQSDGSYTYELDNANPVVDVLGDGDSLTETFTYTVTDGDGTATADLVITIQGTNEAPVAVADTNSVVEDSLPNPVTGNVILNDTDLNSDVLTVIEIDGEPASVNVPIQTVYGTLIIDSDGAYEYELDNDNPLVDALPVGGTLLESFTYTISDPSGAVASATLEIDITGANDRPTLTALTEQDDRVNNPIAPVDVGGADVDTGDTLVYTDAGSLPPGLTINPVTGIVTGVPTIPGVYSVTITVTDNEGDTGSISFDWTVTNTPPVAVPNTNSISEDAVVAISGDIRANDFDAEDPTSALVITSVNGITSPGIVTGNYGTLSFNADGTYTYTLDSTNPNINAFPAGFIASDTFAYEISDTLGLTTASNLTINVVGENDAPTAVNDSFVTTEDLAVSDNVIPNDTEIDTGDTLSILSVNGNLQVIGTPFTLPSGALLTINSDGTYDYDPNGAFDSLLPGETGSDSFNYTITDSNGGTSTATVNATITGVNDPPRATDDFAQTIEEIPVIIPVLDNDLDPEGGALTFAIETLPTNGTIVVLPDGSIEYTPDLEFIGTDSFTYSQTDPLGATAIANVQIIVEPEFIYAFDSFNNFLEMFDDKKDDSIGRELLLSQLIPSLAPEPILAGYAKPGTILVGRMYNVDGSVLAETSTSADQAGNWVLQFFGSRVSPDTFVIIEHIATESVALGQTNFRLTPDTYRSMQMNTQHDRATTMGTILGDLPSNAIQGEFAENINPLRLLD